MFLDSQPLEFWHSQSLVAKTTLKAHPLPGMPMKIQMSATTTAILEMVCQYGPVSMHHVDIVHMKMKKAQILTNEDD